jgi:uncharacterized protein YvpB
MQIFFEHCKHQQLHLPQILQSAHGSISIGCFVTSLARNSLQVQGKKAKKKLLSN